VYRAEHLLRWFHAKDIVQLESLAMWRSAPKHTYLLKTESTQCFLAIRKIKAGWLANSKKLMLMVAQFGIFAVWTIANIANLFIEPKSPIPTHS
jgi:hypothetical protein